MNVGPYTMITDRVSPQTPWGYRDANRINAAVNYIQGNAGTVNSALLDPTHLSGSFTNEPTGAATFTVAIYATSDTAFSTPLATKAQTQAAEGGQVEMSLTYQGVEYRAVIYRSGSGISGTFMDNDNYALRFLSATAAGKGTHTFTNLATKTWEQNAFVPWEDINGNLFKPWYETVKHVGTYDTIDLDWNVWGGREENTGEVMEYTSMPFDVSAANDLERALGTAWDWITHRAPLYTGAAYTGPYMMG